MMDINSFIANMERRFGGIGDYRQAEYKAAVKFFAGCRSVVDVGCGTGGFLRVLAEAGVRDVHGVDLNPDCVRVCEEQGYNAVLGDALDIPYEADRFDGAYCSHVMHIFPTIGAVTLIKELSRVVKPNGFIAITTVPMYPRFFVEGADARPYPPQAIRGMLRKPKAGSHSAPTVYGLPPLTEEGFWPRRPALFECNFQGGPLYWKMQQFFNQLQYACGLRRFWTINGYIMLLRNTK